MATLEDAGVWANAIAAAPNARAETKKLFVKLKTPKCEDTTIIVVRPSERSADREAEHRPFLVKRICLSVSQNGIRERRRVRERGAVGHDRRLNILADHGGVVRE